MTTETLRSLTHETVEIYARTAKTIVRTYRVGANRALGGFRKRLSATAVKIEQPLVSSFVNVGEQLATLIDTRVDTLSSAANGAIDMLAKGSYKTLGTVAGAADRFYQAFPSRAGEMFAQINMPAVRLSRDLAARVSRGAESVAKRVGGEHRAAAAAKPVRKPAKRTARPAAAKAAKRARKA